MDKKTLLGVLLATGAVWVTATLGVAQSSETKAGLGFRDELSVADSAEIYASEEIGVGDDDPDELSVADSAEVYAAVDLEGEADAIADSIRGSIEGSTEVYATGRHDSDDDAIADSIRGSEGRIQIVPRRTHIRLDRTRQFRVTGQVTGTWTLVGSSGEGVGSIDTTGLFTAQTGGWVIIGLKDAQADTLFSMTDTIWVMGGPTRVGHKCEKVYSADDTLVSVQFPPQAAARAMVVLIEKRGQDELPVQARGHGSAVVIFKFTAVDAESGEDVGGKGFAAKVMLTLHYQDSDVPAGVDEKHLLVATFDENLEEWVLVPTAAIVSVDRQENTVTVAIEHASYWAVMDAASLGQPTPVQSSSWGALKNNDAK